MAASGPVRSDSKKASTYSAKEWILFAIYPFAKSAVIPFTQPIAKVAAIQQKSTTFDGGVLNLFKAVKKIYKTSGLSGFFHGTTPTMTRELFKSSYKAPLQIFAYDLAAHQVPQEVVGSEVIKGTFAGIIFGIADSLIAGPIDRYKTKVMTQDNKSTLRNYVQAVFINAQNKKNPSWAALNEFYRGLGITATKQSLVNSVFFVSHDIANKAVQPYQEEHKKAAVVFSTVVPGIAAAFVGAPLDVVKTLSQQHIGVKQGVLALLAQVLKKSGPKGLIAGIPARCLLIASGYSINAFLLNIIKENRRATKSHHNDDFKANLRSLEEELGQLSLNDSDELTPVRTFVPQQITWLDAECPFSAEVVLQEKIINRPRALKN